jgi:arsenate reductase
MAPVEPGVRVQVQIFGRRDCSETRKAERWFKERRVPFQFVDLKIKGLAPRELESVARAIGWENLLDRDSRRFLEKGLAFMTPARIPQVLLDDSLLLRTPIVRNGREATAGMKPEVWSRWK